MSQENTKRILVVDDEETIRRLLTARFTREGWAVECAEDGNRGLEIAKSWHPSVIVTDVKMPGMDGFQLIDALRAAGHDGPVVVITGHGEKECAIESMHKGAFDYLEKPFDMDEIAFVVRRALDRDELRRANNRLVEELKSMNTRLEEKLEVTTELLDRTVPPATDPDKDLLVGESEAIDNLKSTIRTIAEAFRGNNDPVVLVTGESGVGKEMVARYIHEKTFSLRGGKGGKNDAPFVAINCTAFPEHLLESELFGYEKGAFTGAMSRKLGLFELASGGTLFLDEIGDMDLRMQVKLLRVLQERVVRRLGGTQDIAVRTHIVAATNKDLASAVQAKTFREDLYYRINTLPLIIPPLRNRSEDIIPLSNHFLKKLTAARAKQFKGFSPNATKALQGYRWPGNVRELKSVIERAVILEKGPYLELPQLRQESLRLALNANGDPGQDGAGNVASISSGRKKASDGSSGDGDALPEGLAAMEMAVPTELPDGQSLSDLRKTADEHFVRQLLVQHLSRDQGNVSAIARHLKIDRANLLRMFRRYAIDPDLFRKKEDKSQAA